MLTKIRFFIQSRILVPYFVFWGRLVIKRWQPRTIVVTGSAGKTSLFNLIKTSLGSRAYCSERANTNIGLACNLVGLAGITNSRWRWLVLLFEVPLRSLVSKPGQEFYLVEFDVAEPLSRINLIADLKPEICLLTNVTITHAARFDKAAQNRQTTTAQLITQNFARLVNLATGVIYLPASQPEIEKFFGPSPAEIIKVSNHCKSYQVTARSSSFTIGNKKFNFNQPQPPALSQQLNQLVKLAGYLNLELPQNFDQPVSGPGRSNGFEGIRDSSIIDSSYNSNPASFKAILAMAEAIKAKKKWLVAGHYAELGRQELLAHQQMARLILDSDFDRVLLFGDILKQQAYPILKQSEQFQTRTSSHDNHYDLIEELRAGLTAGDLVVVKGSSDSFLENVVAQILVNPVHEDYLCRREPIHRKQRERFLAGQIINSN